MEDDQIHCHNCKKKTNNIDSKTVQTNNGLYRKAAKFQCVKQIKGNLFINMKM